jgi:hypothetical protein
MMAFCHVPIHGNLMLHVLSGLPVKEAPVPRGLRGSSWVGGPRRFRLTSRQTNRGIL